MARQNNLLLIENDMAVRDALTHVLSTENYNVLRAASSEEALLSYRHNPVDMVLLDLNLGLENGWDVFHTLRQLRSDLPIIVTSGQSELLGHSSAIDADGVLEKPFDIGALVSLLKEATSPPGENSTSRKSSVPRFSTPSEDRTTFTRNSSCCALSKPSRSKGFVPFFGILCSSGPAHLDTLRGLSKKIVSR